MMRVILLYPRVSFLDGVCLRSLTLVRRHLSGFMLPPSLSFL